MREADGRDEVLRADALLERVGEILETQRVGPGAGTEIGRSRQGRSLRAFRFGRGGFRVSLLGGCHADEPVGPRFLRHLAAYLGGLPSTDPLLTGLEWWVLPHINPDGEVANRAWHDEDDETFDPARYLLHMEREAPGDDVEFCFPRDPGDEAARPENRAAREWWRGAEGPFRVHASLHGMALGAGPWFLVEPEWRDRCERLKQICARRTRELGYRLHDVERRGEKGFFRIERGFATRPDSSRMRAHFLERGDAETARLFRPSSMETIRSLGGDTLTLVSEMPLFIAPGIGAEPGPPDPVAERWRGRAERWRAELVTAAEETARLADVLVRVREEAREAGLRPMPVSDQMELQWTMVAAGIEQVATAEEGDAA